ANFRETRRVGPTSEARKFGGRHLIAGSRSASWDVWRSPHGDRMPPITRRQYLSLLAVSSLGLGSPARAAADVEPVSEPKLPGELETMDLELDAVRRMPRRARV